MNLHKIVSIVPYQINQLVVFIRKGFYLIYLSFSQAGGQSSQPTLGAGGNYAPAVAGGAIAQPIPIGSGHGMLGYQFDDEEMMKLKAERGGKAGGWSIELSKKRALEEAFGSIWI